MKNQQLIDAIATLHSLRERVAILGCAAAVERMTHLIEAIEDELELIAKPQKQRQTGAAKTTRHPCPYCDWRFVTKDARDRHAATCGHRPA